MLNLNYNYLNTNRKPLYPFKDIVDWNFYEKTITFSNITYASPITFATMSIGFNPYTPTTLFISGSGTSGSLQSGSKLNQPVNISLTGSGVWPTTGSNQLSILITNNSGFFQTASLYMSAVQGNMNLSGSKISSSFTPPDNKKYNIIGQANHTKGNIYNPNVSWVLKNTSPVSTLTPINNSQSASFNIVKDTNISLINFQNVTGSTSSSFAYAYNFGVTASLTSSIENSATGSTTMSISIPEAGVATSSYYFNANSVGTHIITSSFAATTDAPYTITASITYNKGNISNSKISYFTSASHAYNINLTSSFNIVKNLSENIVNVPFIDGIITGSTTNNYAFNITASLTSSWQMAFSSASQQYYFAKTTFSSPELGVYTSSFSSASIITSSFQATTDIQNYTFTSSLKEIALQAFSASFIVIGGGGGGSAAGLGGGIGAGGGAGGWQQINLPIVPLIEYKTISIGKGGSAGINSGSFKGGNGTFTTISYWNNNQFLTASVNGGGGGNVNGIGGTSGNGFNGNGGGGGGTISASNGANGGTYLGGGQGVAGVYYPQPPNYDPFSPPISIGSPAPIINLPIPNQIYTASMSGSGGNGGWYGPNGVFELPAYEGTFGGGGGAGGNGGNTTNRPGAKGGDGALIIIYQGAPKLTIENGYTDYIVPSISGSDYTVHYVTGSNSTIKYLPQ